MTCAACCRDRPLGRLPCPHCGHGICAIDPPAGFADRVLARHQREERRRNRWSVAAAAAFVVGLGLWAAVTDAVHRQVPVAPATPAAVAVVHPVWPLPTSELESAPEATIALTLKAASEVGRQAGRWLPVAEPWSPPLDAVDPFEATRVPAQYVQATVLGSIEPVRLSATRAWRQLRDFIEKDTLETLRVWTRS